MGAIVATIGRSKLASSLPQLPAGARAKLAGALGSGAASGGHVSAHVTHALHQAFVSALAAGLQVGAGVALGGALLALWLIGSARTSSAELRPSERRAAEATAA